MRTLLVEDDRLLGDGIRTGLQQDGFVVDWLYDSEKVESSLQDGEFDIVILDLGLPDRDGIEVLKSIRNLKIEVPVLILTARDNLNDRVQGLDLGADDYMTKPFDLEELTARARALVRRSQGRSTTILEQGELRLDPSKHEVHYKGELIDLPPKEFSVLQVLMENLGQVISKSQLEEKIYGWKQDVGSNTMEVHVHHLRKKINNDCIRTVRGVGYIFEM